MTTAAKGLAHAGERRSSRQWQAPGWRTDECVLAALDAPVGKDLADLGPRHQIDAQSLLWVLGSNECAPHRAQAA